jgi:hypothetical protein
MAHVVKGMCERQIGHSSLEREICLAGLNKRNCNHCVTQNMGAFVGVYSLLCSCRHSCFSAMDAVELEYNLASGSSSFSFYFLNYARVHFC